MDPQPRASMEAADPVEQNRQGIKTGNGIENRALETEVIGLQTVIIIYFMGGFHESSQFSGRRRAKIPFNCRSRSSLENGLTM